MAHPPPVIGELVVVALKAENLEHQAPKKQDPFCLFRVGEIVKRTKTDYGGGQHPIWDDQVNMPIPAGYHQMQVTIFDKDTHANNVMGVGVVDLTKVLREKEHDGYFPLTFRGKQNCGEIYLELTYYSAQNTVVRPQQEVRYQYPPGYVPGGGGGYRPPPQQHRPPPSQQQYRPAPSHQMQQPHGMHPQRPLPMQHPPQQQYRPSPQPPPQQMHSRPPPLNTMPPPHHSPYPPTQPRPSTSMGTAQHYSPGIPSSQPLLSAPYQPAPSPATRPAQLNYPPQPPYSTGYPPPPQHSATPPGGFHDPTHRPTYPPQPQNYQQRPPHPPGGFRPNNNNYPPY